MSAVGSVVHRWRLIIDYVEDHRPRVMTFGREEDFNAEVESLTSVDYNGAPIKELTGVKIRLEEKAVATYSIAINDPRTGSPLGGPGVQG